MSQTIIPDIALTYARIVGQYAHFFDKPEDRLRFFNKTLPKQISHCEKLNNSLSRFKFFEKTKLHQVILDWWLYVLIIREVKQFSRSEAKGACRISFRKKVPFGSLLLFHVYKFRYVLGTLGVLAIAVLTVGLCSVVIKAFNRPAASAIVQNRPASNRTAGLEGIAVAKHLPDYKPAKVWLVEQKDGVERYSNGVRILRDYETDNHRRGYNIFNRDGGKISTALYHDPVGIVYHTSESEMIPFNSENNNSIENHSNGLLQYVQKHRSYNYVIDRFGQVYRIVRDDQAANHAGNSIWADQKGLYVGLNESFLGVCFETRSEADHLDEQLTEAQLLAGRLLTQVLRNRYNIEDANTITHGLVSVSPSKMLISYHHDWVRNFPFEALGLSDKYSVPTVSISVYGFTYDDSVVENAGGEIWAGAKLAEEEFRRRSERAQIDVAEMRRRMRDLYRQQLGEQNATRRSLGEKEQETKVDALNTGSEQSFDSELQGDGE